MRKADFIDIAIKIFGIYLFVKLLALFDELISAFTFYVYLSDNNITRQSDNKIILTVAVIQFLITLSAAVFMTFGSKLITRKICSDQDFESKDILLFSDKKSLIEIVLYVIGILLIVYSIPDFLSRLFSFSQTRNEIFSRDMGTTILIAFIVRIAIGLLIIIYNDKLIHFFFKDKKGEIKE